jgi:hypothetical protein
MLTDAVRQGCLTLPLAPSTNAPTCAPVAALDVLLDELVHDRGER